MIKTEGFVHFTIPVKDLDRSEKFYAEVFGFEKIHRNAHMVFLNAHGVPFVLTLSQLEINPNPEGVHDIHTAFRVSPQEYDRALAFLAGKGIKTFNEEHRDKGAFQGRSVYFHDPDRNVLEIIDLRRGPVREGE